jgi:cell division protein FtsQ
VRDAEYFRLRIVQITGNKTLTQQDVLYMLALPSNATLFQLDLSRMGTRLKRHPYVKMVTLRRRFPDTLTVVVQERSPYLIVVSGWQRMVLDAEGVVLHPHRLVRDRQLPELRLHHKRALTPGMHLRQKEVQRALELVRAYKISPVAAMMQLVSFTVEESGVSVWEIEPYAFVIRLGEGGIEAQLGRLPPVLQYVEQRDIAVRLVDVSYRRRVIVTLVAS